MVISLDAVAMSEELDRLRDQVARLTGLLLQHGISPSEGQPGPNRQTALPVRRIVSAVDRVGYSTRDPRR